MFAAERERLWRVIQFRLAEPLGGRLDPDDVLQEAFLAASQRLKHYADSPATSPLIWLRMMVNQTLVDLHRQHKGAQKRDAGREVSLDGAPYARATSVALGFQRPAGSQSVINSRAGYLRVRMAARVNEQTAHAA